jgi:hypothetical protein
MTQGNKKHLLPSAKEGPRLERNWSHDLGCTNGHFELNGYGLGLNKSEQQTEMRVKGVHQED